VTRDELTQSAEHPDGVRVRITLDGKFLPYKW
jgi:cyanate lyase